MAIGDIQLIEDENGKAKFPITHFRAVLNSDGENLEEFLGSYVGNSGVVVKGSVDSVSSLPNIGEIGDAYLVGEDLYIWVGNGQGDVDTPSSAWKNAGPIRGPQGVGFQSISSQEDGTFVITLSDGNTITIDLNHTHENYYTKEVVTSLPSGGFLPDVVYKLGTLSGAVTFALATTITGNVNHYFWTFSTGTTAPTVTWPNGLTWAGGSAPNVAANKTYQISVLDSIAYYSDV